MPTSSPSPSLPHPRLSIATDPFFSTSTNPGTPTASASLRLVGTYPEHIQEYAVIEDLLFVLMGIDGTFVKLLYPNTFHEEEEDSIKDSFSRSQRDNLWDEIRYSIDPTLDPSLRHLVEKILPLATYYVSVNAFANQYARFEYGTINHALCSGLQVFLKEYLTFIAQLEHQFQTSPKFTLQRFWFYAQETIEDMGVLHGLAMKIRNLSKEDDDVHMEEDLEVVLENIVGESKTDEIQIPEWRKGGAILNILADRLVGMSGHPKCKKIYSFLLSCASVPYSQILNMWIYRGEINDNYNEFMIVEKKNVKKETLKEDFNDSYWETRYSIREGQVPGYLEPLMTQILLAGKYLNVVRECGVNIVKPEDMEAVMAEREATDRQDVLMEEDHSIRNSRVHTRNIQRISMEQVHVPTRNDVWAAVNGGNFVKNLDIAYKYANHTLLNLLLREQQLIARLRSLKHYFFLDQSDFLTSFLDLAKDELYKPAKEISLTRLQSLLDLVLRNSSSVAAYDPFKEDVKISMSSHRLVKQLLRVINVAGIESLPADTYTGARNIRSRLSMIGADTLDTAYPLPERSNSLSAMIGSNAREKITGYEALTLDYTVTFPLSLVISRKSLTKYQLLFRHLLFLKHVEESLCGKWMDQKEARWKRRSKIPEIEEWKYRIFSLRTRMLAFVQQFAYYITNEVLEPNWARLENNLTKASTIDQVLQYHSDFLDECLKECMLTNFKLLKIYNKITGYCTYFIKNADQLNDLLILAESQEQVDVFGIPKGGIGAKSALASSLEKSNIAIMKTERAFLSHMGLLIEALNYYSATETVQFLSLVVRIDYNLFYKEQPIQDRRSD
ncbi:Spc98 family-domain-containing protein [Spinellus fusiger]|nr:Spc98 family-domain-containing protein [Spinellus fusiger]